MRNSKGFTLIELMIVIAIIGILAAIAIPQYQAYSVRARVGEGFALSAAAKIAVAEYFQTSNDYPADNAAAGLPVATDIKGNDVTSVAVEDNVITVTYSNVRIPGGGTVTLTAASDAGAIRWACAAGTLTASYLPSSCR